MGFRVAPDSGTAISITSGFGANTLIRNGTLRPGSGSTALNANFSNDCRFENLRIEGNNAWCGIYAGGRSLVRDCDVRGCDAYGIYVGDRTEVRDNRVIGGAQIGIRAGGVCRIEGNRVENHGDRGIWVTGADTALANNTVRNNSPNYDIHASTVQVPSPDDLQRQIADAQQQIADAQQQITDVQASVAGVSNVVNQANTTVVNVNDTVEQLQQQVAQLEQRLLHQGAPDGMVLIPGGTNSGTDPSFGAYSLTVDPFFMDRTSVTKEQWDEVYTWAVARGYDFSNEGLGRGVGHPVYRISWFDAVKWCNARSQKEGRVPVYSVSGSAPQSVYRTGVPASHLDVVQNSSANGYRLPTVREWEYAARGGLVGKRFPWGDTINHSNSRLACSDRAVCNICCTYAKIRRSSVATPHP